MHDETSTLHLPTDIHARPACDPKQSTSLSTRVLGLLLALTLNWLLAWTPKFRHLIDDVLIGNHS